MGFENKVSDYLAGLQENIAKTAKDIQLSFKSNTLVEKIQDFIPKLKFSKDLSEKINNLKSVEKKLTDVASLKNNPFGESEVYFAGYIDLMSDANKLSFQIKSMLEQQKPRLARIATVSFKKAIKNTKKFFNQINELNKKTEEFKGFVDLNSNNFFVS